MIPSSLLCAVKPIANQSVLFCIMPRHWASSMQGAAAFTIVAPATAANLGPGFDCLALALDLYNSVEVVPAPGDTGISVEIGGEGAGLLEGDQRNMVLVAMQRLAAEAGRALPALRLRQSN